MCSNHNLAPSITFCCPESEVHISSPDLHGTHPLDHKPQCLSHYVPPGTFLFCLHVFLFWFMLSSLSELPLTHLCYWNSSHPSRLMSRPLSSWRPPWLPAPQPKLIFLPLEGFVYIWSHFIFILWSYNCLCFTSLSLDCVLQKRSIYHVPHWFPLCLRCVPVQYAHFLNECIRPSLRPPHTPSLWFQPQLQGTVSAWVQTHFVLLQ